jgi:hypothetical protein
MDDLYNSLNKQPSAGQRMAEGLTSAAERAQQGDSGHHVGVQIDMRAVD